MSEMKKKAKANRKHLRFLWRENEGSLFEEARISWDEEGSPRFKGFLYDLQEIRYGRITEKQMNEMERIAQQNALSNSRYADR